MPLPPAHNPRSGKKVRLRTRRLRTRVLIGLAIAVAIGGIGYGVSLVSYLPQFNVQTVSIVGANSLSPALVERYADTILYDGTFSPLSRDNIFLYPRALLERDIVSFFPRVKSAKVARESLLATAVVVTIEERKPYAAWCLPTGQAGGASGDCYLMDSTGFIFARAATSTPGITSTYRFSGGIIGNPTGQTYLSGHLAGIEALLDRLGQTGYEPELVRAVSEQDFVISLGRGYDLKASFGVTADSLLRNLQLVLGSDALRGTADRLEYIDLRFGNRVYYKLKGEEQATTVPQS